jgi:hypothetical protein
MVKEELNQTTKDAAAAAVAEVPMLTAKQVKTLSEKFVFVLQCLTCKSMKRKDALLKVGMKASEYTTAEKVVATEDATLIACMNDGRLSLSQCRQLAAVNEHERAAAIARILDAKAIAANKNVRSAARTMTVDQFCSSALEEGRLALLSLEDQAKDWSFLRKCDQKKRRAIVSRAKSLKDITDRVIAKILEGGEHVSER